MTAATAALFRFQDRPFLVRFHDGLEPELLGVDFDAEGEMDSGLGIPIV